MGGALLRMSDGGVAHIRGAGIKGCACCSFVSSYLCDFPLGKGRTCDAPLCENHAILQGRRPSNQLRLSFAEDPGPAMDDDDAVHFCPAHHLIARGRDPR